MTIKVIKAGVLTPKRVDYRGECDNCGCKILCDSENDLKDDGYVNYVDCPTEGCKSKILMSKVAYRTGE